MMLGATRSRVARAGRRAVAQEGVVKKVARGGKPKSYKDTISLPSSPIRAVGRPAELEPRLRKKVTEELYRFQNARVKRMAGAAAGNGCLQEEEGRVFHLQDGPPFANGSLHMGHALNKSLKDFVMRIRVLRGDGVIYKPGYDCHGLPIELKALEELKRERKKAKKKAKKAGDKTHISEKPHSALETRQLARKFAADTIKAQNKSFQDIGVMGDWSSETECYRTMTPQYEAEQLRLFGKMVSKGYVVRGARPVHWSVGAGTALAEAELEYKDDHVSTAVHVAMPIAATGENARDDLKGASVAIWTTTPWTLPANKAVAYSGSIQYVLLSKVSSTEASEGVIGATAPGITSVLVAESLSSAYLKSGFEVVRRVDGGELLGMKCESPFTGELVPVLEARHVTDTAGTGFVHTAPGHGMDDFRLCGSHGIEPFAPVNAYGKFTDEAGEGLEGLEVLSKGTHAVLEKVMERGVLLSSSPHKHRYPYCWRSKKPVIFRATDQWFMSLGEGLRDGAMKALEEVKFTPEMGKGRMKAMVGERSEWCISRQRSWGVPIPAVFRKSTGEPVMTPELVEHVAEVVRGHPEGTDAWWSEPLESLLPPSMREDADSYTKGTDTLDVWLDSGSSWWAAPADGSHPQHSPEVPVADISPDVKTDVYLEGSDQHRGWFQSSLLTAVAAGNAGGAPYKNLITHGFVMDAKGQKMSKSIGNVITPESIIHGGEDKKREPALGADVLRWWAATQDYGKDISMSTDTLKKSASDLKKVRNTLRFLASVSGQPETNGVKAETPDLRSFPTPDRYFLSKARGLASTVSDAYDEYKFNDAMVAVVKFVNEYSAYLEPSKDHLYCGHPESPERLAAHGTSSAIFQVLATAIAPIAPFTAEEVYEAYPLRAEVMGEEDFNSIYAAGWGLGNSGIPEDIISSEEEEFMESAMRVRKEAFGASLEEAKEKEDVRTIAGAAVKVKVVEGTAFASHFTPAGSDTAIQAIKDVNGVIGAGILDLEVVKADPCSTEKKAGIQGVKVSRSPFHKCPRCWVSSSSLEGDLCARCEAVLN